MQPTAEEVEAGQAVYTKRTLSAYDIIVLGISNSYIWKCPSTRLKNHYNRNVSSNHLDIGVGSGYFLDRCHFPAANPRVALMDMNNESLSFAAHRIARYRPETYRQNILEKITTSIDPFDSVGVNYLLHCLPGAISDKIIIFDHLAPLLKRGARVFGSTILQGDVPRGWMARRLMAFYNKKGIFSNTQDELNGLTASLENRFDNVVVEVVGCVALFSGNAR